MDEQPLVLSRELIVNIENLAELTKGVVVRNAEERASVYGYVKKVKDYRTDVVAFFAPIKQKAHEAWKAITEKEKYFTNKLDGFENTAKRAILTFDQAEEEKRFAEQRRLQAVADEQARKEREKLEKEAAKLKTPELKEARLEAAAAVTAPVIEIAQTAEKQKGEATKTTWKARVINAALVPREYCVPNEKELDAIAKATKGSKQIPGVEFYTEQTLSMRR
jgi:hypothetical protein